MCAPTIVVLVGLLMDKVALGQVARFQASAAKQLRTALYWVFTQRAVVISKKNS
jgi:hypothetical protein